MIKCDFKSLRDFLKFNNLRYINTVTISLKILIFVFDLTENYNLNLYVTDLRLEDDWQRKTHTILQYYLLVITKLGLRKKILYNLSLSTLFAYYERRLMNESFKFFKVSTCKFLSSKIDNTHFVQRK